MEFQPATRVKAPRRKTSTGSSTVQWIRPFLFEKQKNNRIKVPQNSGLESTIRFGIWMYHWIGKKHSVNRIGTFGGFNSDLIDAYCCRVLRVKVVSQQLRQGIHIHIPATCLWYMRLWRDVGLLHPQSTGTASNLCLRFQFRTLEIQFGWSLILYGFCTWIVHSWSFMCFIHHIPSAQCIFACAELGWP